MDLKNKTDGGIIALRWITLIFFLMMWVLLSLVSCSLKIQDNKPKKIEVVIPRKNIYNLQKGRRREKDLLLNIDKQIFFTSI